MLVNFDWEFGSSQSDRERIQSGGGGDEGNSAHESTALAFLPKEALAKPFSREPSFALPSLSLPDTSSAECRREPASSASCLAARLACLLVNTPCNINAC